MTQKMNLLHGAITGGLCLLAFPLMQAATIDWISLCVMGGLSCYLILQSSQANQTKKQDPWKLSLFSVRPFFIIAALIAIILQQILSLDKLSYAAVICLILWWLSPHIHNTSQGSMVGLILCALMPLPSRIEADLSLWLAHLEASLFTQTAQMIGLNIYKMGTQVVSGDIAVTINQNCSGVLLLTPALLGMAVAFDQLKISRSIRPIPLILLTVGAAFIFAFSVNMVRIAILIILHYQAGDVLVASFHDFLGWVIYPVIWAMPIILSNQRRTYTLLAGLTEGQLFKVRSFHPLHPLLLALIVTFTISKLVHPSIWTDQTNMKFDMPTYIAGWVGETATISAEEKRILKANIAHRFRYFNIDNARQVEVTYIYHTDPVKAAEHNSKKCFQALGWRVQTIAQTQFSKALTIPANVTLYQASSHQNKQWVTEVIIRPHQGLNPLPESISQPKPTSIHSVPAQPLAYGGTGGVWRLQIVEHMSPVGAQASAAQTASGPTTLMPAQMEAVAVFTSALIKATTPYDPAHTQGRISGGQNITQTAQKKETDQ